MPAAAEPDPERPVRDRRLRRGPVSPAGLERVRSEAASAEQRASFLAALAVLGLSDSVRTAFAVTRELRLHPHAEPVTLGTATVAAVLAAVAFAACILAGVATLLDRAHLRLVWQATFRRDRRAGGALAERVYHEAAWRGEGETVQVLQTKLVLGLRCTGWFLVGGIGWVLAKTFAT